MDSMLSEVVEATAPRAFRQMMNMADNQRRRGTQQSFMTGRQRAKLIYVELDVTDDKLATVIGEQISAMAWKSDSPRSVEAFVAQYDAFMSRLPAGHGPSGERVMVMFRGIWGSWADDAPVRLRADCEKCGARWALGDRIAPKPPACASPYFFAE